MLQYTSKAAEENSAYSRKEYKYEYEPSYIHTETTVKQNHT